MRRWYLITSSSKAFWSPATVRWTSWKSTSPGRGSAPPVEAAPGGTGGGEAVIETKEACRAPMRPETFRPVPSSGRANIPHAATPSNAKGRCAVPAIANARVDRTRPAEAASTPGDQDPPALALLPAAPLAPTTTSTAHRSAAGRPRDVRQSATRCRRPAARSPAKGTRAHRGRPRTRRRQEHRPARVWIGGAAPHAKAPRGNSPPGRCAWRGVRQARLNTSVPLVPPKPKLFLTATSILRSRASLAQ